MASGGFVHMEETTFDIWARHMGDLGNEGTLLYDRSV